MNALRVIFVLLFIGTITLSTVYLINFVQNTMENIEKEVRHLNKNLQFHN